MQEEYYQEQPEYYEEENDQEFNEGMYPDPEENYYEEEQ